MISTFVSFRDTDGSNNELGHFEFIAVPRSGERVILDNRGGIDGSPAYPPLRVVEVINHARPKGDVENSLHHIELRCEAIG